jgi:hypothetical protein
MTLLILYTYYIPEKQNFSSSSSNSDLPGMVITSKCKCKNIIHCMAFVGLEESRELQKEVAAFLQTIFSCRFYVAQISDRAIEVEKNIVFSIFVASL